MGLFTNSQRRLATRTRRRAWTLEVLECRATPSGSQPIARDDFTDTDGNNPVAVDVLKNDSPSSGLGVSFGPVRVVGAAAHGTTTVDSRTGEITYTATGDFSGTDHFTYSFTDTAGQDSNVATVTVIVNRPTARDDFADTDGNNPVTVDVLANASHPDGPGTLDPATVTVVGGPAHGTATVDPATGAVTYTASGLFVGTDSLQYTVTDIHGATSNAATVTLIVNRPTAA